MKHSLTKTIDGVDCQLRDVVYSEFGATTDQELEVALTQSHGLFRDPNRRAEFLKDSTYSWNSVNKSKENDAVDSQYSQEELQEADPIDDTDFINSLLDSSNPSLELEAVIEETLYSDFNTDEDLEERDSTYSAMVNTRLTFLKKPLNMQLKEIHRDHTRFYRSRGSKLKPSELDLMMEDYRYELHRIIALAKNRVVSSGGNLDTILRLSNFSNGDTKLVKASTSLTLLFKRIEDTYNKFGYIPRDLQTKLESALSILISHFVLDVYGEEIEKRNSTLSEMANVNSNQIG